MFHNSDELLVLIVSVIILLLAINDVVFRVINYFCTIPCNVLNALYIFYRICATNNFNIFQIC